MPDGRYTSTGRLEDTPFSNDYLSAHLGYTFGDAGNHYIALKAEQHRLSSKSWVTDLGDETPFFSIDLPQRDRRKIGIYYDGKDLGPVLRNVHLDAYYQTIDRLFINERVLTPFVNQTTPPFNAYRDATSIGRSESDDRIVNHGGTAQADFQFHPDHYTIFGVNWLTDTLAADKFSRTENSGFPPFMWSSFPPGVTTSETSDKATANTVSMFAQNEWSFAGDFKLTTGARYYYTKTEHDYSSGTTQPDRSDGRLVTSAGLTYTSIENTTLRALYSEGYISPSLVQMFMVTTGGGETIHGNPELDPETSRSFELGARYNSGDLILDGTVFYTEARNYITTEPCSAGVCPTGESRYVNANRATTYGLELAAEYTVPGTAFTPYVSGAWMRREAQFTGDFGGLSSYATYDTNTPALSGRLGVRWQGEVANHNAWADLYIRGGSGAKQTSWVVPRTGAAGFVTDSVPGYATLNLAFGGSFGGEDDDRFRYAVHFNNILDKEYRSSLAELPGVGRSVEVSLRMKF